MNIAVNFKDQCIKSDTELRHAIFPSQTIIYRAITLLGNNSEENIEENDISSHIELIPQRPQEQICFVYMYFIKIY